MGHEPIVEAEHPAQFLQAIAREPEQHLVESRFPGTGKGVDELRFDASIVDRQLVVVEIGAQFCAGQLSKDGALGRHWRASLVGSFDHFDLHRLCSVDEGRASVSDRTPVDVHAISLMIERS